MGPKRIFPFPVAAVLLLAAMMSCGAPEDSGAFVRSTGKGPDGRYGFTVDLGDSLCRHALYFYTVIDACPGDFEAMPHLLQLRIEATSPSGKVFSETAGIDKDSCIHRTFYSRQYEALYRSGFSPVEYGQWAISVSVLNEGAFPGLRGLGLKHMKL